MMSEVRLASDITLCALDSTEFIMPIIDCGGCKCESDSHFIDVCSSCICFSVVAPLLSESQVRSISLQVLVH